jgi:hypothetical protein
MNPLPFRPITYEYFLSIPSLLNEKELETEEWKKKLNTRIWNRIQSPTVATIISTFLKMSDSNRAEYEKDFKNQVERVIPHLQFSTKLKNIHFQLKRQQEKVAIYEKEFKELDPNKIIKKFNEIKDQIKKIKESVDRSGCINKKQEEQISKLKKELNDLKNKRDVLIVKLKESQQTLSKHLTARE